MRRSKKRMSKKLTAFLAALFLSGASALSVSAARVDDQYSFNYYGDTVPSPPACSFTREIYGRDLGLDNLKGPEDMYITDDGAVYLLDSGNNRVIITDTGFETATVLSEFMLDGAAQTLNGPMGIFVDEATGEIYIADTNNGRVLISDSQGNVTGQLTLPPENDVLDEGEAFLPQKVSLDITGCLCVIAGGVNEGIMQFTRDGEFNGFLGAPDVKVDLGQLFWRTFMTEEQKAKTQMFTPIIYSNLCIDEQGSIYAPIRTTDYEATEKFKKLNAGGYDITRTMGVYPPVGDPFPIILDATTDPVQFKSTLFVDVIAYDNGLYSLLDQTMGRVFTYDSDGNLLFVFGNKGSSVGTFLFPVAVEQHGDCLYVLDKNKNGVLQFTMTEYGLNLRMANQYFVQGEYESSAALYQSIIDQNINSEIGYIGLGKNLLIQKEYERAMEAFRLGNYRTGYDEAFSQYRGQLTTRYFVPIFLVGAAVAAGLVALLIWATRENKKEKPVRRNFFGCLTYCFHILWHPFDGFWDLKHEKRGSAAAATAILAAFVVTYVLNIQYAGFLVNTTDLRYFSLSRAVFVVLFAFLLWLVANSSVATWIYGEGSFRDVYIYSCYALTPLVLLMNAATVVSLFITLDEAVFYHLLIGLGVAWFLFLLFAGNIQVHQYSVKSGVANLAVSFVEIAVMLFLIMVGLSLMQQIASFADTIFMELTVR